MSLCILTDTTALLPPVTTGGGKALSVLKLQMDNGGLTLPGMHDFLEVFNHLEGEFGSILALTSSMDIFPTLETAQQAALSHGGSAKIEVLDTLQFGPGLGILAQIAARKAASGAGLAETRETTRALLPYFFTILSPDTLPVLQPGSRSILPAATGEAPGFLPVYSLEEGQLSLYKKVRTQRHLLEVFQEFLEEFETPQQLVYFHGRSAALHVRPLREAIDTLFPGVPFIDLEISETLAGLFGEHTTGLTVLEAPREKG